jgi:hypothetical protein
MRNFNTSVAKGLWINGRDSIMHAFEHFSERGLERSNRQHHDKWIVVSVHHAAECICNALLLQVEPKSPLFFRDGNVWFPSLSRTLKQLQTPINSARLNPAELHLLRLLNQLLDIRHQFMHRTAPKEIDVSIAAMCMIGLLKYIERRNGETASDIFRQHPPIEADVVEAIRYTRLEEYRQFVELFLREKYADRQLSECPSCGALAVFSSVCEACFEELLCVRCPETGEEAWEIRGDAMVECPHCGGPHVP